MQAARRLILAHGHLAALICVAALALRLLIPAGYMVSGDHGRIGITLCPGVVDRQPSMMTDMPGMHHATPDRGKSEDHGKAEMPCAFSGLSAQVLGGVDPVLLATALAVVAATALRVAPRTIVPAVPYLRPPLRGPPPF